DHAAAAADLAARDAHHAAACAAAAADLAARDAVTAAAHAARSARSARYALAGGAADVYAAEWKRQAAHLGELIEAAQ
ncbi:MAG: hypothetical protein HY057_14355, partial [Rhodospirillales bacterium]|nr:hypothetical protein [Rhodospirillales bacterium]